MRPLLSMLAVLMLGAGAPAMAHAQAAAPRGAASPVTIACPSRVAAQTVFECVVTVALLKTATAAQSPDGEPLIARVYIPREVFHVAHSDGAQFDADDRVVRWPIDTRAGSPNTFSISLIVDPNGAGLVRQITTVVSPDPAGRAPVRATGWQTAATIHIDRGTHTNLGFGYIPVRPTLTFAIALLSPPLLLFVLWWLRRGRRARARLPRRPGDPIVGKDMVMIPATIAVASAALVAAWMPACLESLRSRTTFIESSCTVLDRGTVASNQTRNPESPEPMTALRYDTGGQPRTSTGLDVIGTFLSGRDAQAYEQFEIGQHYPCWYDNARPSRVVLRRGPSGAAMFIIVPLLILAGSLSMARSAWRS